MSIDKITSRCCEPHKNAILPIQTETLMTQDTVRIIALVLLLVVIAIIFLRRKGKKNKVEDDF